MNKIVASILIFITLISCKTMIEKIAEDTNKFDNIIRVKLIFDTEIKIKITKDIIIQNDNTNENIPLDKNTNQIKIKIENDKVFLNNNPMDFPIKIFSIKDKLIKINNKNFLGTIKIIPYENGFDVINLIPLETYLMSVVMSEVPLSFNIEAIKAQAIVARTYALLFMDKYTKIRDYDVDNTTRFQVYKGYSSFIQYQYIKKLEQAIKETNGLIIAYNDKPILAYFHSNSGGKLNSGLEYFGKHSDLPYLVSKDDPYSLNYPGSKWEYKIKIDDFKKAFNITSDLTFDSIIYNSEGFVDKIQTQNGFLYPKNIRKNINQVKIKSEKFKIFFNQDGKYLLLSGIGYGHGVGMSQWGAHGMAEKGFNYRQIIDFYYPDTRIKNIQYENRTF